jgi:hypothetical protein
MKLKLVEEIYCATCGYNENFYSHPNCEYEDEEECTNLQCYCDEVADCEIFKSEIEEEE